MTRQLDQVGLMQRLVEVLREIQRDYRWAARNPDELRSLLAQAIRMLDQVDPEGRINGYMKAIGRKGGRVSGRKRMTNLTDEQRSAIARNAALSRWSKEPK